MQIPAISNTLNNTQNFSSASVEFDANAKRVLKLFLSKRQLNKINAWTQLVDQRTAHVQKIEICGYTDGKDLYAFIKGEDGKYLTSRQDKGSLQTIMRFIKKTIKEAIKIDKKIADDLEREQIINGFKHENVIDTGI